MSRACTIMTTAERDPTQRRMFRHASGLVLISALLIWSLEIHPISAQQQYRNTSGYTCSGTTRCQTYAFYRTAGSQSTLTSIVTLFNTSVEGIATASDVDPNRTIPFNDRDPLYIPLNCSCFNNTFRALTSQQIKSGDTMYKFANGTYQGLTTWEAISVANPTVIITNMTVGDYLVIPLRCACPTTTQRRAGSRILLTYSIFPDETLKFISGLFNIPEVELQTANNGASSANLAAFTTLLVPLPSLVPLSTMKFPSPPPPSVEAPGPAPSTLVPVITNKDPSKTSMYIGIVFGGFGMALAFILACVLCATVKRYKNIIRKIEYENRGLLNRKSSVTDIDSLDTANSSLVSGMTDLFGCDKLTKFSYEELDTATNHFSEDNRIQGSVFLAKLNGSFVAIKRMKGNMSDELKILSQVHHGNVVKLVGMCARDSDGRSENLYIVYEYAENGSLSDCLHHQMAYPTSNFSRSVGLLIWNTRMQIAVDIASGLEYLHNYTNPSLVHKDVKSSNILLDKNFRAKVANFGMAKPADSGEPGPLMTEHIVGTQGYMAPEYLEHGLVSTKADVFSFGVVLLELLSGREAICNDGGGEFTMLSATISNVLSGDDQMAKLQAWMDPRLQNAYPSDIALSVAILAKSCVETDPRSRPDMKQISFALSKMSSASQEWQMSTGYSNHPIEAR
ncbi:protein LYK5 isoform X2 [Physcomitrium patens]|nr:protein LYK5-like isoform X2 [Physcomitrium patens]PNR51715.1 hypothetical protein PHYPA_010903 [Physcomitrium patens]|eukprot:XP_024381282.1 protein LYK5-like isoform X2 [Physcomitrella patens]